MSNLFNSVKGTELPSVWYRVASSAICNVVVRHTKFKLSELSGSEEGDFFYLFSLYSIV